jgi:hypothetical protein
MVTVGGAAKTTFPVWEKYIIILRKIISGFKNLACFILFQ